MEDEGIAGQQNSFKEILQEANPKHPTQPVWGSLSPAGDVALSLEASRALPPEPVLKCSAQTGQCQQSSGVQHTEAAPGATVQSSAAPSAAESQASPVRQQQLPHGQNKNPKESYFLGTEVPGTRTRETPRIAVRWSGGQEAETDPYSKRAAGPGDQQRTARGQQ